MRFRLWQLQGLELATTTLAVSGASFIAYGVIAVTTGSTWPVLETFALRISSALTIAGTAITAASVYLYSPNAAPPWSISRNWTAWLVITACVVAAACLVRWQLPAVIVNGFAILGLAGGIARLRPNRAFALKPGDQWAGEP